MVKTNTFFYLNHIYLNLTKNIYLQFLLAADNFVIIITYLWLDWITFDGTW